MAAGVRAVVLVALLAACGPGPAAPTSHPVRVARSPVTVETAAATTSGPGASPVTSPPRPLPAARPGGGLWAVVIGIDDYPGRGRDLRSARNDAKDADQLLDRLAIPDRRRIDLVDARATVAGIRRALDWLATGGPDRTVVFFFAGHVRRLAPGVEALVAADGRVLADRELAARLGRVAARRMWIVIAGCYAGGFTEVVAPGRILTAAAPADRLAYESTALGRSYLSEYLVRRGLLAGRAATVEGAFAWARAALRREHPNRLPVQFDALEGDFELPVTAPPAASTTTTTEVQRATPTTTTTTTTSPPPQRRGCLLTVGTSVRCPEKQ
jgi:hypothetical protein